MKDCTGSAPQTLESLIPPDMFVGTSLILRRAGRFLYGIRPPKAEGQAVILELTGIGGKLEKEDGSPAAGALREAMEEIGCPVSLLSSEGTWVVHGPGKLETVRLRSKPGADKPVALVFRRYRTPPHQPWSSLNQGEACLVVFLAELKHEPKPVMELPALIWLKAKQIVAAAREDVPLEHLLAEGAELIERQSEMLPRSALVRLTDSQEALVLGLGEDAEEYYGNLSGRN